MLFYMHEIYRYLNSCLNSFVLRKNFPWKQRHSCSPEHKVIRVSFLTVLCPSSVSASVRQCHSALTFSFKRLLLQNHSLDFDHTLQVCSLGVPLPRLFKPFQLVAEKGQGGQKKGFKNAIFKNIFV